MKEGKTAAPVGGWKEGENRPTETPIGAPTNNSRDYQQPQCCHKHKQTKNRRVSHEIHTSHYYYHTEKEREKSSLFA